ncbi:sodium-dependent multivitamin transporter-like [Ruditapes philippinarum]|uniref:sodium-dependent multivitamin transporter-like n=1 Tax=Ruditapes philippinarum TaxID=129788 RepID=UPI00295A5D6E|nr:sodium-dependent multivitamin transporter-like [Ruditapes philippinarum]
MVSFLILLVLCQILSVVFLLLKGCVIGGFLGLVLPLWISIGAYNLPSSGYSLEFPTDNCTSDDIAQNITMTTNTSEVVAAAAELSGVELLYTVSYLWYPSIGVATVVIVGLVVSFATAPYFPQEEVDPKYLIPFFDRLFCCLPESWRQPCRCGYKFQRPEDIMHERDQEIVVQNGEIVDRKSEKKPLPEQEVQGNVSCLAYKQSDSPQFVYINDLSPTGHAFVPYNAYDRAPDVGEIPPKYDNINM